LIFSGSKITNFNLVITGLASNGQLNSIYYGIRPDPQRWQHRNPGLSRTGDVGAYADRSGLPALLEKPQKGFGTILRSATGIRPVVFSLERSLEREKRDEQILSVTERGDRLNDDGMEGGDQGGNLERQTTGL